LTGGVRRVALLTGTGTLLVAIGVFSSAGWPVVLGGFILIVLAAAPNERSRP
jgi:hypothetical protein